jgi:hypothetical protein
VDRKADAPEVDVDVVDEDEPDVGRTFVCARCRAEITSVDAKLQMSGAFEHILCNPHGHVFRIGCFSEAPGAASAGEANAFFTWFPGYSWRVAICRSCLAHLGWSYGDEAFWGLVLDALEISSP